MAEDDFYKIEEFEIPANRLADWLRILRKLQESKEPAMPYTAFEKKDRGILDGISWQSDLIHISSGVEVDYSSPEGKVPDYSELMGYGTVTVPDKNKLKKIIRMLDDQLKKAPNQPPIKKVESLRLLKLADEYAKVHPKTKWHCQECQELLDVLTGSAQIYKYLLKFAMHEYAKCETRRHWNRFEIDQDAKSIKFFSVDKSQNLS